MTADESQQSAEASLVAPFYEALRDERVVVQRCDDCGHLKFPPLELCSECWSDEQSWVDIEPVGELWSWVVYHRALSPEFTEVPYVIGRVKSSAGPVFTVRLSVPSDQLFIGMALKAEFYHEPGQLSLLRFTNL